MKENIIQQKSFDFAIRVVNAYKYLTKENNEYTLSKQFLRAGTSIGANIEEAIGGYSKADFLHKMTIAYKEARETKYWLKLMKATNVLQEDLADSLLTDCEELLKIIGSIQRSVKNS